MAKQDAELKALAQKATPGEWEVRDAVPYGDGQVIFVGRNEDNREIARWNWHHGNTRNNIAFIAAANPATVLDLLTRLEKATEALHEIERGGGHGESRIARIALAKLEAER